MGSVIVMMRWTGDVLFLALVVESAQWGKTTLCEISAQA